MLSSVEDRAQKARSAVISVTEKLRIGGSHLKFRHRNFQKLMSSSVFLYFLYQPR